MPAPEFEIETKFGKVKFAYTHPNMAYVNINDVVINGVLYDVISIELSGEEGKKWETSHYSAYRADRRDVMYKTRQIIEKAIVDAWSQAVTPAMAELALRYYLTDYIAQQQKEIKKLEEQIEELKKDIAEKQAFLLKYNEIQ